MSYYQTCMGICIGVIIFGLCVNFVNIMDVFPMDYSNEITQEGNTSDTVKKITSGGINPSGIDFGSIFSILFVLSMLISIPILLLTHSINAVGAWLFSSIFWIAYSNAVGIMLAAGFLGGIMAVFTGIFTIIISFIFMGAIIGMFTGSG